MEDLTADVVIVGGGIQGLSIAAHLVDRGFTNVVILERGEKIPHRYSSTERSAAMIMMQAHTFDERKVELSLASHPEYLAFEQRFGQKLKYYNCGSVLYCTSPEKGVGLKELVNIQNRFGIPAEIISNSRLHDLVPYLFVDDIDTAVFCPVDGYINQADAVGGYLKHIRNKVVVLLESEVKEIIVINKEVAAVRIQNTRTQSLEEISTRIVINAAGPFAPLIGKMVGINIPIETTTRTLWFSTPKNDLNSMPILEHVDSEWYLRPSSPNDILIGVGIKDKITGNLDDESNFNPKHKEETKQYLADRTPGLIQAQVGTGWAGIRELTPDQLPIIGPVDEVKGFLNCCGWSGYGVMQAPIAGELVANYLANGERTFEFKRNGNAFTIDINDFSLSRFSNARGYFRPS